MQTPPPVTGTHPDSFRDNPEALAFLRRRIASYGFILGSFGWFAFAIRALTAVAQGFWDKFVADEPKVAHMAAASAFLLMGIAARYAPPRLSVLVAIDALGLVSASAGYVAMIFDIPLPFDPVLVGCLITTNSMMARAVYVPSPARRTALIGVVISAMIVGGAWVLTRDQLLAEPALLTFFDTNRFGWGPEDFAAVNVVNATMWMLFGVVLSTLASHVIYGLRREVQDVRRLGQYTLDQKLGEGGMGIVYRASHAMLKRAAAVKVLKAGSVGERELDRFEREVQLTASLTHPNTITVFDFGRTPEGLFYYAMEYLDGATLEDIVEVDGPQPPGRVRHVLLQCARALVEAHGVGLIHRDIKPANIMLGELGGEPDVAKVLDFGLVKELDRATSESLSAVDQITGTPQYLSPEAIGDPASIDGRADLYALGAVGYYLLTGTHVFQGKTVVEVCSHHLHSEPESPSERLGEAIPPGLEALLLETLRKRPGDRPASAEAFASALQALADETGPWTPPAGRRWWDQHGKALAQRRRQTGGSTGPATLAIDMGER